MTEPTTQTLELPGATLTYDVREAKSDRTEPILLMIGSPMDAGGFTTLAARFPDRTVVTYDPRGVGRSPRGDGVTAATPEEHGEDLHRLISELDAGPVDIFASSGGAVNALALVTRHGEGVRALVAHEPPLATVLPDRVQVLAVTRDIHETYERDGLGPAMAKFIAFTSVRGPIPPDFPNHAPNPADVGLPTEDDGRRDHPLLGPHMVYIPGYEPDFDSLRGASTRIVVAGGAESEGTFPYRAALAVAERLGTEPVIFPSHHAGFGQQGDPDAFAATLRGVLTDVPLPTMPGPLSNAHTVSKLPAQDLERARAFYRDKLGLEPVEERTGGLRYVCGPTEFHLFSSAGAPSGKSTQMAFEVENLEATLADLRARGVSFERFEMSGFDVRGDAIVAPDNYPSKGTGEIGTFFYDSEGNLIGIAQPLHEGAS
jgi:pimeloyl-ACP methyl ester carboxylesterase/catechol 2,3-dioxygenase-like lactoylglutathione lyase family enzyme